MSPQIVCIITLILVVAALISNKIPSAAIGLGIPFLMILGGVFETPLKAMSDLAGPSTMLVCCIMILSQGIFKSGLAEKIGGAMLKATGGRNSETAVLMIIIVVSAVMSMFLPNTGCTTILLPICIAISMCSGISRSRTLFVMNLAVGLGGSITAMGTTINTACRGLIQDNGYGTVSFFGFGISAIPALIVGVIYMLTIGRRFLPNWVKENTASTDEVAKQEELTPAEAAKKKRRMIFAGIAFVLQVFGVVAESWTGVQAWVFGLAGVLILLLTKTISEKEAFQIPWGTLFFVFGTSVMATGFKLAGVAEMMIGPVKAILGESPSPTILTLVLFTLGAVFTQFMSNFGTFGIFSGVAITLAESIGANPSTLMIALALGCNSSYATPMATTANAVIIGDGEIKFTDWLKNGIPHIIFAGIFSVILLPIFFPFY